MGLRRRLGVFIVRAAPFTAPMLMALLRTLDELEPTVKNLRLALACILGVLGFFRPSDVICLLRGDVSFVSHPRYPHVLLHLDHSKTDTAWVGAYVVIASSTLAQLHIAARLQRYLQVSAAAWSLTDASPLFPADDGAGPWSPAAFSHHLRAVMLPMQSAGEPTLQDIDVMTQISPRSFKRGGSASAAAGGADPAAISVHGWTSRKTAENLRASVMLETYCDLVDHTRAESLMRRFNVTYRMGALPGMVPAATASTF